MEEKWACLPCQDAASFRRQGKSLRRPQPSACESQRLVSSSQTDSSTSASRCEQPKCSSANVLRHVVTWRDVASDVSSEYTHSPTRYIVIRDNSSLARWC
eukprot:1185038-Prorocentrum_minimum.AAC.1